MELARLLRLTLTPGANLNSILDQTSALALRTVRDEAARLLPKSAGRLATLKPLAKAIGVSEATIQRIVQAQIAGRNNESILTLLRSTRQAVIETFNAVKFVATVESDLPLPNAFVYCTQRDERVRQTHAELEGAALPLSDPFWQIYWPPNDHNCRCFVRALYGAFSRHKPKTKYKPPEDFRRNLGEDFVKNLLT